jgi:hypothetical protein
VRPWRRTEWGVEVLPDRSERLLAEATKRRGLSSQEEERPILQLRALGEHTVDQRPVATAEILDVEASAAPHDASVPRGYTWIAEMQRRGALVTAGPAAELEGSDDRNDTRNRRVSSDPGRPDDHEVSARRRSPVELELGGVFPRAGVPRARHVR